MEVNKGTGSHKNLVKKIMENIDGDEENEKLSQDGPSNNENEVGNNLTDIYNEAIQKERAPFIRHLTPITLIDEKELPSPRLMNNDDFRDKEPEKK